MMARLPESPTKTGMRELMSVISSTRDEYRPACMTRPTTPSPVMTTWPLRTPDCVPAVMMMDWAKAPPVSATTRAVWKAGACSGTNSICRRSIAFSASSASTPSRCPAAFSSLILRSMPPL